MQCDRKNCENDECELFSKRYGNICNECFEELVQSGPTTNIVEFMNIGKGYNQEEKEEARARYSAVFEWEDPWDIDNY
jgi:hypothetical protein